MDVPPVGREVEDRVADHLSGAVIGDVAATAGLEDVETALAQKLGWEEHVLLPRVAPEGEDRVVLEEQQLVLDAPGLSLGDEPLLKVETLGIRDAAEPTDLQTPHQPAISKPMPGSRGREAKRGSVPCSGGGGRSRSIRRSPRNRN